MKKSSLLVGSTFAALAFGMAQPAFAQDTTTPPAAPCADANNDGVCDTDAPTAEGDAIVVVGSRIRRDNFNSASPVIVITREETRAAGFNTTTEALQSNGVTGGAAQVNNAFGGFVTEGGPGANTLSLRGLGATRSLILLNGRRLAPAGTRGSVGASDLNVLPSAMVERIEVLRDGASSVYGSDAVAGVVNIVTRQNIEGFTFEGQHNFTEVGAGGSRRYSLVYGTTGDRYSLAASVEYIQRDNLTLGDRDYLRCQTSYRLSAPGAAPGTGDFIDPTTGQPKCYPLGVTGEDGVTINTIATSGVLAVPAAGATDPRFNRLRPNAAVTTGVVGYEGVGGFNNNLNVRDTFEPLLLRESLISPATFYNAFLQGSYDVGILGNGELYFDFMYSRRESAQASYRQLLLDYAVGSPLIPANLQFSRLSAFPTNLTNGQPLGVRAFPTNITNGQPLGVRAFIGFGQTDNEQQVEFYRLGGGLRGDFIFSGWRYDMFVGSTWSDATYSFESFLTDRLAQSLDVVASGSGFVCRNPANGCVAAPVLTPAVVGGNLPQNYRDFILQNVTGRTRYEEQVANFSIDGTLFALPYGNVQAAFGVEFRRASINDTPPIDSQTGNLFNLTSAGITRGSDEVLEAYGEIEVPLLRNVPFAQNLTLNLSARVTDYRSYGTDYTYKIGGNYSPVEWLSLRGTYGTSYRAPALYEQFLSPTSGFLSSNGDPCNNYGALPAGSIRRANCAAEGLDPNFSATSGITVFQLGGASAGLAAETSVNWTVGAILQPDFGDAFGSLSIAVDYYSIEVSNGVARAGAGNLLDLCYDDPQFRAGGGFCRLSTRAAGSNALTVNDSFINLSTDRVRGIDYTVEYSRNIGTARLRLFGSVSQYLEQSNRLFATDPIDDLNGTLNTPKFAGSFDASIQWQSWRLRYGVEWVDATDSTEYLGLDPATSTYIFNVDDYFLHSTSLRWQGDDFGITLGVRNLFNTNPPQISSGAYNRIGNSPLYSGYDYVGRSFFVSVSADF